MPPLLAPAEPEAPIRTPGEPAAEPGARERLRRSRGPIRWSPRRHRHRRPHRHQASRPLPASRRPRSAPAAPGAPDEEADLAQRIADEKQLRQSTDQSIQLLALQFQATRCNEEDVLGR